MIGKTRQILYNKPLIYLYNPCALRFGCRLLWGCSLDELIKLYNNNISANHLDIGIGTGYFLDKCNFPEPNPRLALMDLNKTCLKIAAKRLSRYRPEIYQRNILEPLDIDTTKFDSIGILNVLHCLPGDMEHKATAFENIKSMLNPGGIVFGSTILGKGIRNSIMATLALTVSNVIGTMSNRGDGLEGLQSSLSKHFSESRIDLVGNEAIFRAKLPMI